MFRQLLNNLSSAIILATLALPASADLTDQWYAGIGGSGSLLLPRADDTTITRVNEQGSGGVVFVGRDFDNRSSGQFQLYSLGEMSFSDNSVASYIAAEASLLYRFYDTRDYQRNATFGASFYGRFGLGYLDRDADIALRDNSGSSVYFGVGGGVETYISNTLSVRGEVIYQDSDAITASISLVTRFGGGRNRIPQLPQPRLPRTEPAETAGPTASAPAATVEEPVRSNGVQRPQARPLGTDVPNNAPTRRPFPDDANTPSALPEVTILGSSLELGDTPSTQIPRPPVPETNSGTGTGIGTGTVAGTDARFPSAAPTDFQRLADTDNDGIPDSVDQCGDSNNYYPVGRSGCSLIDTLDNQIKFQENSPLPLSSAERALEQLASIMIEYPQARIEIVAHTDNAGSAQAKALLARQRLKAIGIYLVQRGITKDRLLLRSFGGKRPAFDNSTVEGRRANNRIEIIEKP